MNLTHVTSGRSVLKAPETPTVYVVDGDATLRDTLDPILRRAGWQPRMSASAEEFLSRPRPEVAGCLLVELHLPGLSGLELQRLVQDHAEMPVIFMTSHADVQTTVAAMKAGAFEFLVKPFSHDDLMTALQRAVERSRAAMRHLGLIRMLEQRYESLSRREREVMSLVVTGRLNKQVGGELGISEITVKTHRGKLMRKMQAGSFAELVSMAAQLGRGMHASFMHSDLFA